MSHPTLEFQSTPLKKVVSFGNSLLPAASLVGLAVAERAHHVVSGAGDLAHILPVLAGAAGYATLHELLRSWHMKHLMSGVLRDRESKVEQDSDDDRLYNEHLAEAVGKTIGDVLRALPDGTVSVLDKDKIAALVASAPIAFKGAVESGLAPPELDDDQLLAVVIAAAEGQFQHWGEFAMWAALLRAMADHAGVAPLDTTLLRIGEACQKCFIERFFDTIKTDLGRRGGAYASIHLRMMGELVVLARENAGANRQIQQIQNATAMKLDDLLALVSQKSEEIIGTAVGTTEFPRLRKVAIRLSQLDGRLEGIQGRLAKIVEQQKKLETKLLHKEQTTHQDARSAQIAAAAEAKRTRGTITAAFVGVIACVAGGAYVVGQRMAEQTAEMKRQSAHLDEWINRWKQAGVDTTTGRPPPFPSQADAETRKLGESSDPLIRAKRKLIENNPLGARRALEEWNKLTEDVFSYLTTMGDTHYFEGEFDEAVPWYEQALELPGRDKDAAALSNLARALQSCRQGDIGARIDRAIALHAEALELQQVNSPEWAMTQNNLGNAWRNKPTDDKSENIERAIDAYTAALTVYTPERFPADSAMTQNNLGTAWRDNPTGDKGDNIHNAITAYTAALSVYTRERFPNEWAAVQNNLGIALWEKPIGEKGENIERAIASYNAALTVYTPERFPADWAMTQNNLCVAWRDRPTGDTSQNIDNAVVACTAALTVWTLERFPADWAKAQNSLGLALLEKSNGDRNENIEKAIAALKLALTVYTREGFPAEWAVTQNSLGYAWEEKSSDDPRENLARAAEFYKLALDIFTPQAFPQYYEIVVRNLERAQKKLDDLP